MDTLEHKAEQLIADDIARQVYSEGYGVSASGNFVKIVKGNKTLFFGRANDFDINALRRGEERLLYYGIK